MPIGAKAWPILADVLADSQKTNFFNTFSGTNTITASNRSTFVTKDLGKRAPSSVQMTHTTMSFARPHLTNESVSTAHHTTLREEQHLALGPRLTSKQDCHVARRFCTTMHLCTDCKVGWGAGQYHADVRPIIIVKTTRQQSMKFCNLDDRITQVRNMIMLPRAFRPQRYVMRHIPCSCTDIVFWDQS